MLSCHLLMGPDEDPDPVGLVLDEVVDQLAPDLGPQDRRDPPDFRHLTKTNCFVLSPFTPF